MSHDSNHQTVMPKKLAQALIEAGMKHFDMGGSLLGDMGNASMAQSANNARLAPQGQQAPAGGAQVKAQGLGAQNTGTSANIASATGLPNTPLAQFMSGIAEGTMNQYQANAPDITRQDFQTKLADLQNRSDSIYGQQYNLAQTLMNQSNGQGPNPALAQLNQTTGQNAQMQGALMASQRGANANPALMARQAAMQGANVQQQAAGQAATMRAQQQLAAQQQLGAQQQAMAGNTLGYQNMLQQGQAAQNNVITQGEMGAQNINANVAGQNSQQKGSMLGGLLGGGSAGGALASIFYKGGQVPKMDLGGPMPDYMPTLIPYQNFSTAAANGTKGSSGGGKKSSPSEQSYVGTAQPWESGGGLAGGPGDTEGMGLGAAPVYASKGGQIPLKSYLAGGGVPGKAKIKGNSEKNDTQPALLSPGEIVLPRSVTEAPDMEKKAIEFLRHIKGKKAGYEKVAEAKKKAKGDDNGNS